MKQAPPARGTDSDGESEIVEAVLQATHSVLIAAAVAVLGGTPLWWRLSGMLRGGAGLYGCHRLGREAVRSRWGRTDAASRTAIFASARGTDHRGSSSSRVPRTFARREAYDGGHELVDEAEKAGFDAQDGPAP